VDTAGPGDDTLVARVAAAVPDAARTVLQVGRGHGSLAAELQRHRSDRVVTELGLADGAAGAGLEAGSVDAIVYPGVLPQVLDPLTMLERHRALLASEGTVVVSVPNLQHHSIVSQLVRGVFPYDAHGLLDPSYVRLFTAASTVQVLLDAGYAPDAVDRVQDQGASELLVAGAPLFEQLGVGAKDAERDLQSSWIVFRAVPIDDLDDDAEPGDEAPITVVACVNDDAQLSANLMRSPWLGPDGPHQLLTFRGCASAAEGLNAGIAQAEHDLVVLVHQDVYLPAGWPARLRRQWRTAARAGGDIAMAGVFGVRSRTEPFDAIGRVVHRDRLLVHHQLPADVDGLDELVMVVPATTALRVDPALGWHLYGTDLALQAQRAGSRVVVLDAPCQHNSLTGRVPWQYRQSERALARKWEAMLPIHTNLSSIGAWLLDDHVEGRPEPEELGAGPADEGAGAATDRAGVDAMAALVGRLRREQVELNVELEQARLQVASMQASPFWRARQAFDAVRSRLLPRR
jgi:hypothetical protein